nr:tripartite tricarboxylate transporter substrate binding protein [Pseudomonas sp.]
SNRIHLAFDNMPPFLPRIQNGDLRALAVTSSRRSPLLPDVPTLIEEGFTGIDTPARFAVFGPPGLPAKLVQRYNEAFTQAVRDPVVAERLQAASVVPAPGTPQELAERLRSEHEIFSKVIKSAGLKFE